MLKSFNNFFIENNISPKGKNFLIAVSGGLDSAVITELFFRKGYSFGIAHCNFLLRGKESDGDEIFVKTMAERLGVPFFSKRFNTLDISEKKGISIQMAAREIRYNWFNEIAGRENFDHIVTAHNLDDQIETFLINLSRGTGISGLKGISPVNEKIIRPLIFASRKEIETFAKKNNIEYRNDSSNDTDKYLRNNIRHNVIPPLKKANPNFYSGFTETLMNINSSWKIYSAEIEAKKMKVLKKDGNDFLIDIRQILMLNQPGVYLYEILSDFGFNYPTVINVLKSLSGQAGKIFFSSSHRLIKDREFLILTSIKEKESEVFLINENDEIIYNPVKLRITTEKNNSDFEIQKDKSVAVFDKSKLKFPLVIRKHNIGDFFIPFGMKGRKKVSDFFIGEKFSLLKKESIWLICSGEDIIWIVGHRTDNRYKINNKTNDILKIFLL
jgi:tRNA(Ile)-lysidine synthase